MTTKRILVVEDEAIIAMEIKRRLEHLDYAVAKICKRGEDALAYLEDHPVDLVLMDIRLQGALDGIDAAKIIDEHHRLPVIFLTAHSDSATLDKAKESLSDGYLVKPVDELQLKIALEMAFSRHAQYQKRQSNTPLSKMDPLKKISLWQDEEALLIKPSEILYLSVDSGMVHFTLSHSTHQQRGNLKYWEEKLTSYGFFRCHKNFIVNLSKVIGFVQNVDRTYSVKLLGTKDLVPVSRIKLQGLKDLIEV